MSRPLEHGVQQVGKIAEPRRPMEALKISTAATLKELAAEYVFFTPALLYTLLPLGDRDPLAEFVALTNCPVEPVWLNFQREILPGLADPAWTHRIGLFRRDQWQLLREFFGRAAFSDQATGLVARVRWQEITIPDPIAMERAIHVPDRGWATVTVHNMALETTQYRAYIYGGQFTYDHNVPDDAALFAKAVRREHEDPYGYVEQQIENETGEKPEEQRLRRQIDNPTLQQQTAEAQIALAAKLEKDLQSGTQPERTFPDAGI